MPEFELKLSDLALNQLDDLRKVGESRTSVIERALRLFWYLHREQAKGSEIIIQECKGDTEKIMVLK